MHQPTTQILNMLDQVYILARGGVCIYAGAPSQIRSYTHHIPEMHGIECKYPLDLLVSYSCKGSQNSTVQSLAQINNNQNLVSDSLLLKSTREIDEMPFLNRTRFSLQSVFILSRRYLVYIGGHLWKEWLVLAGLYLSYGYVLSLCFNRNIVNAAGCTQVGADFQSVTFLTDQQNMATNIKYNIVAWCIFLLIVTVQTVVNWFREYELFVNEHQNGKVLHLTVVGGGVHA